MIDSEHWQQLLKDAGVGWVLDSHGKDPALLGDRLNAELQEVRAVLADKLGDGAPNAEELIVSRPEDFRAVIQTFASPMTAEIRAAAVLATVDGTSIVGLQLDYRFRNRFHMRVLLETRDGALAEFVSHDIWDAEALRHLGIMKINDQPVFQGYLSFRSG